MSIDSIKNVFSTNTYKPITKNQENEVFHLLFNFYKNDTKNFLETKLLFADKNLGENRNLSVKLLDSVLLVSKNKSYHQIQTKAYAILGFANNFEPKKSNDYYFKALKLITLHKLKTKFKCELLLQIGDNFNRLDDSGKAIDTNKHTRKRILNLVLVWVIYTILFLIDLMPCQTFKKAYNIF